MIRTGIIVFALNLAIVFASNKDYAIADKKLTPTGSMPVVGLGTWQAKDDKFETALNAALEAGYRHIDTAYIYENEKIIGNTLKKWFDSGKIKRENIFITTKLPGIGLRPEGVHKYINRSLTALQLDYVDLYLIHTPFGFPDGDTLFPLKDGKIQLDKTTDHIAVWKEMEKLVDTGKAKAIGVSNFNETQIQRILDIARIKPANLQVELHAYHQQKPIVEFCQKNNITVTAYSPLGSPGLGKHITKPGTNEPLPDILNNPTVEEIAKKHKKSAAQVVLRHGLQKGLIVIPKSTNVNRVKENLNLCDFELDKTDMEKLNSLDHGRHGKIIDFQVFDGIKEHPEYPWW